MAVSEDTQELPSTPKMGEVEVFDLEGKMHRMSRLNANDMVQHLKWQYANPVNKALMTPRVVVLVSKRDASKTAQTGADTEHLDLATLSDDALRAFAKEHFDMDFTSAVSRTDVMNALMAEQTT